MFKSLQGKPTTFGSSIEVIFSNLLPIVGTALLVWMIKMVGFMMCFVPGLIAALMFYVAMPVVVVEGKSLMRATQRSDYLGSRRLHSGKWRHYGTPWLALVDRS